MKKNKIIVARIVLNKRVQMIWRELNHPRTMGILTRTGTESANVERKQLADLSWKINTDISPVYTGRKISSELTGTLSNRRRPPDDGNWKRDSSFETSLRMHNTL